MFVLEALWMLEAAMYKAVYTRAGEGQTQVHTNKQDVDHDPLKYKGVCPGGLLLHGGMLF